MRIDPVHLEPLGTTRVRLAWTTAHPTWLALVYLDGRLVASDGREPEGTERSITLLWPADKTHAVEVHEVAEAPVLPVAIAPPARIRPTISWSATAAAEKYRLYHRESPDAADELLFSGRVDPDELGICRMTSPITLDGRGGRWPAFRVEALDRFGHVSHRDAWLEWAAEPDDAPKLAISAGSGSGLYNIAISESTES